MTRDVKLDTVCRVTIPKEVREELGLDVGSNMRMFFDKEKKTITLIPILSDDLLDNLQELKTFYSMMKDSGIIDEHYTEVLKNLTKGV